MSKKLEGNGMWESSRMMLPEHKERILERRRALGKQQRPLLDEQNMEVMADTLARAMIGRLEVQLSLFDPFGPAGHAGIVEKIDPQLRRLKLRSAREVLWIPLDDILNVEFARES